MDKEFRYPKDPLKNLKWRSKMLLRAREDSYFCSVVTQLFHEDILFAFNGFFYTLDVRKRPYQHQPFCTWDYQDEAIVGLAESLRIGRDEVWEKSRDMGASWMVLLTFLWFWLSPEGGGDFLLGSRIEDYVDRRGDMRALFPKLRYARDKLPSWLRPKGFNPRKHDTYMKMENPETGSTIIGESNNANFSTGGRFMGILFDEFAKWESTDVQAWTAAGDATPSRIAVSTAFGAGGQYYNLVTDGKTLKRRLFWTEHPEKGANLSCVWPPPNWEDKERLGEFWVPQEKLTSPWYEKEAQRRSEKEMAQEIDISYLGSGNPIFGGKAFDSLQFYLSIPDQPKKWGLFDYSSGRLIFSEAEPADNEGHLLVYRPYDAKMSYTIGVDVVEGTEDGDYAVVLVYERETNSVAAVYWSRVDEVVLSSVVVAIYKEYSHKDPQDAKNPWLGIETTGPGLATFDLVAAADISNLFMAARYDVSVGGVSYKKGWRTDRNSKNELISGIRRWLIDRAGDLNSHRLCGELSTFVRTATGKAAAKSGCHDDMVIAFGIAIQLDELCPPAVDMPKAKKIAQMSDFTLIEDMEKLRVDEPITLGERCLADALERRKYRAGDYDAFMLEGSELVWG